MIYHCAEGEIASAVAWVGKNIHTANMARIGTNLTIIIHTNEIWNHSYWYIGIYVVTTFAWEHNLRKGISSSYVDGPGCETMWDDGIRREWRDTSNSNQKIIQYICSQQLYDSDATIQCLNMKQALPCYVMLDLMAGSEAASLVL